MKRCDLTLPQPLLKPNEWSSKGGAVLSLGFVASCGPPVQEWVEGLFRRPEGLERNQPTWLLTRADLRVDRTDPLQAALDDARGSVFCRFPTREVVIATSTECDLGEIEVAWKERAKAWGLSSVPALVQDQNIKEWTALNFGACARLIFPETFARLDGGTGRWESLLELYQSELPNEDRPWEALRFFAGFLRQEEACDFGREDAAPVQVADEAALEWARFQALISPHDECAEAKSLLGEQLMVNPAAQILSFAEEGRVRAIVRRRSVHWTLDEFELDWMDVALIDAVQENFRTERPRLLSEVEREYPSTSPLWILTPAESCAGSSFETRLKRLTERGVLLTGEGR